MFAGICDRDHAAAPAARPAMNLLPRKCVWTAEARELIGDT